MKGKLTIAIKELRKSYDLSDHKLEVLKGIDLEVTSGGYLAIMGPSGSGKSTLLNLLGCLDRPDSGQYLLDEEDVSRMSDDELSQVRLQKLGFIFQSFQLISQLNVMENVELPLLYRGVEEREAREMAMTKIAEVDMIDRMHHLPRQLSGGQQQRVAIARALVGDPKIILADEPTGNLDSRTGLEIMTLLDELNQRGVCIVLVTHEADIAEHAQSIIVMRDGLIDHSKKSKKELA